MRYKPVAQRPDSRLLALLPFLAIFFPGQPEPGGIAGRFAVGQTATPPVTILYQNFPNPFPASEAGGGETRIWFDLARRSPVELAVFDLRGRLVRRLIPAAGCGPQELPAGRFGREDGPPGDPCLRLTWDGRDEEGRTAARGVYLLRLKAGGTVDVRRVVFWP